MIIYEKQLIHNIYNIRYTEKHINNYMAYLISIIIPCYKVEKYLSQCIESIISQTYHNLEIILVDDGSPDNCGRICDDYAKRDNRIKVIHKKNGGLSDARNVAIDLATGEYITFVDSDDYISADYVETLYNLCHKYQCKVSVASFQAFHEDSGPVLLSNKEYHEDCQSAIEAIEQMFYQEKFDTAAWAKLYHRSLFNTGIRYPKGLLYEDLPTTYLLMAGADKIAFCNRIIYYYLLRPNSIEGSKFSPWKMDSALKIFEMMEAHDELISKVKKAFECRMMSFAFHLLLKMPEGYEHRDILWERIKTVRMSVILDSRARKKARLAGIVSYFGMKNVKRIFGFIDKRE